MKLNAIPHTVDEKRKIIRLLKKLPLFGGLYDDEFIHLSDICHGRPVKNKEYIFKTGDHSLSMFVLLTGQVAITTSNKGTIYEVSPGEFFGEIGMITQNMRSASARAIDDCVVLEISNEDYSLLLGQHPRINAIMMRHIAESLARHILRMNAQD